MTEIGRNIVPPDEAHGEFIGLARFSGQGAESLKTIHEWATESYRGRPFHTSPSVDKASFTDLIQELIDQGYPVHHVDIRGSWAEIDTVEDYDRVSRNLHAILKTDRSRE